MSAKTAKKAENHSKEGPLGTVHLLRKGKRVGSWLGKTLIFPYIGGYIVQD